MSRRVATVGGPTIVRSLAALARGPEPVASGGRGLPTAISRARVPPVEVEGALLLRWSLPHNIWSAHSLNGVQLTSMRPGTFAHNAAFHVAIALRTTAFFCTSLRRSKESMWLHRLLFFAVMTGAPGRALSKRRVDLGEADRFLQGLVREVGREKARLDILLDLGAIGPVGKFLLNATQASFGQGFLLAHQASPRFCRWLGGFVEEESINAHMQLLEDLDAGRLPQFVKATAPASVREHYSLPVGAAVRDVFKCMLAEGMLSR